MGDVFTPQKRSAVMSAIRSRGNRDTELKLVQILRRLKIRGWRRNMAVHGKPDFCFPASKLAIFVDGCFWHGCPKHGRKPASNTAYWHRKLARNKVRDRAVSRFLRKEGWHVLRVWEHDLAKPASLARKIRRVLKPLKPGPDERSLTPPGKLLQ